MSSTSGASAPGGRAPKPEGRVEMIDVITRAAADLFVNTLPSKVSIRDIASRAGVSHALVHRYLGSKEEILRRVLAYRRDEAAAYWRNEHCKGAARCALDPDSPPGRYLRTAVFASIDGIRLHPEDIRLPDAGYMHEASASSKLPESVTQAGFDARVLFSAATAMTASMAVAEEFFLVQSGLDTEDRAEVRAEMNRLIMRIMTMGDWNSATS